MSSTAGGTFAFLTAGSFSGINPHVLRELSAGIPELAAVHVDVPEWARAHPRVLASSLLEAFAGNPRRPPRNRDELWGARLRSGTLSRHLRASLAERAAEEDIRFTFQTQSLFDGSVPGLPHFVYTDHTAMASLLYPGFDPQLLPPASWREREREIYQHASRVFTMSTHVSRSLVEHYGIAPAKVRCVFAGSNVADDAPLAPLEGKRILFVGRDWDRKGGPDLLAAFLQLQNEHPDAELVIAGCCPAIDRAGVHVLGELPAGRVAEEFSRASVFCLPTRREPFGIVFVEALTFGVPVVATAIGAVPDVVQDGETGLLVAPGDVAGLAKALRTLLADPALGRRMGREGHRRVGRRYTWKQAVASIVSDVRATLTHAPGHTPPGR